MLKTLEEPPPHACLILLASDREAVLPTVRSRCQLVELDPLPERVVRERLDPGLPEASSIALARLSGGDPAKALFLAGETGSRVREAVEAMLAGAAAGQLADSPWLALLAVAERAGEAAGADVQATFDAESDEGVRHTKSEVESSVKRAARRARTAVLETGLSLAAAWARDWAVARAGSIELAFNRDRVEVLEAQAGGIPVEVATEAVELIEETRLRLRLNVSEELALEALCFRLERLLTGTLAA